MIGIQKTRCFVKENLYLPIEKSRKDAKSQSFLIYCLQL